MSQNFGKPDEYLCVHVREDSSSYVDVAFLPITGRVPVQECIAYLKKNCCEIMNTRSTLDLLNMIDSKVPQKVIVLTQNGTLVFSRNFAVELTSGFLESGELLLCKRDSTFGMSNLFPKGPFTGECRMIEAEWGF